MKTISSFLSLIMLSFTGFSQYITKYPDIPRIDVHTHVSNSYPGIENYLSMRDTLLAKNKMDVAMWINLCSREGGETGIDTITRVSRGRVATCISDFTPHRGGLTHKPKDLAGYMKKGFVGYKIWHGPYYRVLKEGESGIKYFDDPAHEPVLSEMEKIGMVVASVHIADPNGPFGNRTKWCADPVEFWREVMGIERVLQRHPNLKVVAAHCSWLICQDAQIDYLRYMLSTYPNLNVDMAATFSYFYLDNYDNLRDFLIQYSDRLMFGTDEGIYANKSAVAGHANSYARYFQMLESDEVSSGRNPMKGLNLPKEVLEKIYYKNACRIYPGMADKMRKLGYKI
jgi:hypothetical protein